MVKLRSVCLRESSEQSYSADVVSTKLGGAGTCACRLAVIALVAASPDVLKSSRSCGAFTMAGCVRHWLDKLNASCIPTVVLVA